MSQAILQRFGDHRLVEPLTFVAWGELQTGFLLIFGRICFLLLGFLITFIKWSYLLKFTHILHILIFILYTTRKSSKSFNINSVTEIPT